MLNGPCFKSSVSTQLQATIIIILFCGPFPLSLISVCFPLSFNGLVKPLHFTYRSSTSQLYSSFSLFFSKSCLVLLFMYCLLLILFQYMVILQHFEVVETQTGIACPKVFFTLIFRCNVYFGYSKYGNPNSGWKLYPEARMAVEVSDICFVERALLKWQVSLA